MWVVVMQRGRSLLRVMITLGAIEVAVVVPIPGGVPMRRLPSLRLV
jgi:hypothetical protein